MRAWLAMAALGCGSPCPEREPPIGSIEGMRPELVYYARAGERAVLGGFDGAFEAPVRVVGPADEVIAEIVPDPNGRFFLELDAFERVTLEVENGAVDFRLRDPEVARREAVGCEPLSGAGSVPNDLVIGGTPSKPFGVLVRSGDAGVNLVDLEDGLEDGVRIDGSPWMATVLDEPSKRIAVTDFRNGTIHVVDLAQRRVDRTIGPPPPIDLGTPYVLPEPHDVDGDGDIESSVSRFEPTSPQSLAMARGKLVAGYVSFVQSAPPIFLPGVLAVWTVADLEATPRTIVLPVQNPQELRLLADGRLLVVCSGVLDKDSVTARTEGAVIFFDPSSEAIELVISMGDFLPGTAIVAGDRLIVGSLSRGRIRTMNLDGTGVTELHLNKEPVDSVFRMIDLDGGLVAIPSFNTDRLHVLDARANVVDPAPFFGPLQVGPGPPVRSGLQAIARRPGRRGVDFVGPDLFALEGISSEVVGIELRKLLGP